MPALLNFQLFEYTTDQNVTTPSHPSSLPCRGRCVFYFGISSVHWCIRLAALFFKQPRCLYVLRNTVFLQQSGFQWDICLQGIGSEIGSRLRDGTFKKCVAKCPGGASRRRWGDAVRNGPPEESREGSWAEEVVALLQREEISSHRLPRLSPQLVAPFSSTVTRG